jgi:hypothetical protein
VRRDLGPLAALLAAADEELGALARNGAAMAPARVREILAAIAAATEDQRTWLSETDAAFRSGRRARYWRGQFPALAALGAAALHQGKRYYRQDHVAQRADTAAAYAAALEGRPPEGRRVA